MILANINFGSRRNSTNEDVGEVVEYHLASLFKGGQIGGGRFLAWNKGKLISMCCAGRGECNESEIPCRLVKKESGRSR